MTAHTIQLDPPIEVETEHGKGWALFMTDYGPSQNACWTIASEDGTLRHYQTTQVKLSRNFTYEIGSLV